MRKTTLEGELSAHLRHLCDDIGARPVGSQANHAAARYIHSVFASAGLQVSEQRFDWIDWKDHNTTLKVDTLSVRAYANTYSPSCDVTAPTAGVCTVAELEAADLTGKIAILYGELTQAALTPKNFALYQVERDQRMIALLEAKRPAAVITVNLQPPNVDRLVEDRDFVFPSATVSAETGLKLLDREGSLAHLTIVSSAVPSYSANVIGRKINARPERIVICAHYDTKIDTPGASDNGSGTAVLLTLARILAKKPLDISLEFVAFSDEEYFGQDDATYMRDSGDQMGTILAAINFDSVGQALGANTLALMSHSEALSQRVNRIVSRYPGITSVEPWPESNHSTFAWRGVPSLALTSYLAGITRIVHQPTDTTKWISPTKLAELVTLIGEIVEDLQHESLEWSRDYTADSVPK